MKFNVLNDDGKLAFIAHSPTKSDAIRLFAKDWPQMLTMMGHTVKEVDTHDSTGLININYIPSENYKILKGDARDYICDSFTVQEAY